MATEKQLLKLEKIQSVVKNNNNKDVPRLLSRGRIGYEKAIRSIMTVGSWATIVGIITAAIAIIYLVFRWQQSYGYLRDYEIYLTVVSVACSIVSSVLGYKLWSLSATPLFTLVALLIIILCNACLSVGVLPLIVVILGIVALVRYSTFCSWFHGLK